MGGKRLEEERLAKEAEEKRLEEEQLTKEVEDGSATKEVTINEEVDINDKVEEAETEEKRDILSTSTPDLLNRNYSFTTLPLIRQDLDLTVPKHKSKVGSVRIRKKPTDSRYTVPTEPPPKEEEEEISKP